MVLDKRAFCELLVTRLGHESFDATTTICRIRGFSVNALGFAGSLLSTEMSDRGWMERSGPEALLEAVVKPVGSS